MDNPTTTRHLWEANRAVHARLPRRGPIAVDTSVIHQMQREMIAMIDAQKEPTLAELMWWNVMTGGTFDKLSEIFGSLQAWRKRDPFAEFNP